MTNNPEEVRVHQAAYLANLKQKNTPYTVIVEGVDLIVNPQVFPPATDTKLLAANIHLKKGDSILDITSGCGTFAVLAGLQRATGFAVDINPQAVQNTKENLKRHNLPIQALESDLFSKVPQTQFDYIFANGPYIEGEVKDPLELAFYGAKEFHAKFFTKASKFLKPTGKILITFAKWGNVQSFESTMAKKGFKFKVIDKRNSSDGQRTYLLYEATV